MFVCADIQGSDTARFAKASQPAKRYSTIQINLNHKANDKNTSPFMIWQFMLTVSCSSSGSTCWTEHRDTKTAAQLLLQCVSVENCSNKETTSNGAARLMCLSVRSHSSQLRLSLISLFLISLMSFSHWCSDGRRLGVTYSLQHICRLRLRLRRQSTLDVPTCCPKLFELYLLPFANVQSMTTVQHVTF